MTILRAVWGDVIPILARLLIAADRWLIPVPVMFLAPIAITRQTTTSESSLNGTVQVSAAEARQITLRQDAGITLQPTLQSRQMAVTGVVKAGRLADHNVDNGSDGAEPLSTPCASVHEFEDSIQ